mmetsp:Transcript_29739/g.54110  ORF Transcript_29739/g.54110 Transcript_29739/m.54110 type:complete len:249 (+) Transcript_29739:113-859(+)
MGAGAVAKAKDAAAEDQAKVATDLSPEQQTELIMAVKNAGVTLEDAGSDVDWKKVAEEATEEQKDKIWAAMEKSAEISELKAQISDLKAIVQKQAKGITYLWTAHVVHKLREGAEINALDMEAIAGITEFVCMDCGGQVGSCANDEFVEKLVKNCDKLELLDLQYTAAGDESLKAIVENCPNLSTLKVGGSYCEGRSLKGSQITEDSINLVASSLTNLKVLKIRSMHSDRQDEFKEELASKYPGLKVE